MLCQVFIFKTFCFNFLVLFSVKFMYSLPKMDLMTLKIDIYLKLSSVLTIYKPICV